MNKLQFEELAIRYLSGDLDSESILLLKNEIRQSEEAKKTFESIEEIWVASMTQKELDSYDYKAAYQRFLHKISEGNEHELTDNYNEKYSIYHIYRWIGGIVASILILVGATYLAYHQGQKNMQNTFADIVITTPNGSSTHINLPDGSTVKLNGGSRISYSQGYGVNSRIVNLEGEGYFEVKKDSTRPFIVNSADMIVKVLGTKFNFCDYPQESQALVFLDEGKVHLKSIASQQEMIIKPDQHVVLDKTSGSMTLENTNALVNEGHWAEGVIAFNGESLKDIARVLERCYSVKFQISPSKQNSLHFYGVFYKESQNIYDVMNALAATGKFSYKVNGQNIIIH
mgnify:FL=1